MDSIYHLVLGGIWTVPLCLCPSPHTHTHTQKENITFRVTLYLWDFVHQLETPREIFNFKATEKFFSKKKKKNSAYLEKLCLD